MLPCERPSANRLSDKSHLSDRHLFDPNRHATIHRSDSRRVPSRSQLGNRPDLSRSRHVSHRVPNQQSRLPFAASQNRKASLHRQKPPTAEAARRTRRTYWLHNKDTKWDRIRFVSFRVWEQLVLKKDRAVYLVLVADDDEAQIAHIFVRNGLNFRCVHLSHAIKKFERTLPTAAN